MEKKYDIFICDLDKTLARSKSSIDPSMASVISEMLRQGRVFVVISGGMESQIITQVVERLEKNAPLEQLYLMPTSGSRMKQYRQDEWQEIYAHDISEQEKDKIDNVVQEVLAMGLVDIPLETWGPIKEDRLSQMTYSMLGQQAPVEEKERWDPDKSKRRLLVEKIAPQLDEFRVAYGGSTTIDITQKGIDKGFGIEKFFETTEMDITKALFIGDAMTPDGNDYPAIRTGIATYTTTGPSDTEELLRSQL